MGWYDSFRGNVAGVNMSGVGSDAGLGAKAFGDAFVTIGKSMTDATKDAALLKTQEAALRADEAKVKSEEAKTALYGTQNTAALDAIETTKADKETKKLDDAFSTSYRGLEGAENIKLFKDNYQTGNGYGTLSSKAVQEADAYFQSKFNDEAKNKAVSGGYKDFATFAKENEQLVKMADGTTMAQLDKHFSDKDTSEAKMAAQEAKTQNAIAMLEIKREINDINAEKNKAQNENGTKYTQETDTKIANIVAKGMGLDMNNIDGWSKDKQAEFYTNTTGIAKIAKEYNVTPLIALDMYTKANTKTSEATSATPQKSWKDYEK